MNYRTLQKFEISRLKEINREEVIEKLWYCQNNQMILVDEYYNVPGWHPVELPELIKRLHDLYDRGGVIWGGFDGTKITGMVALDQKLIGKNHDQLKLDILYVDANYRNQGVGRKLMELAIDKALSWQAKKLYISATPSENTIRFYKRLGCVLTEDVDPELFELEPEDIHLELLLTAREV